MEIKGKVHCFFEQSGTFKNEFIKLGIPAEDYDIQDNFGQTDHVTDLFAEIEEAFVGGGKIFNSMSKDDLIIAFFPCIYFCAFSQIAMSFGNLNYRCLTQKQKAEKVLERSANREKFFRLAVMMISCAEQRGLRLIMENPWGAPAFLKSNFVYPPAYVDKDRSLRGDYFKKPTAYWFIGCEPTNGFTYQKDKKLKRIKIDCERPTKAGLCSEDRSMISPDYARNFIRDNILGLTDPELCSTGTLFSDINV